MDDKKALFQAVSVSLKTGNVAEAIRLLDNAVGAGMRDPEVFSDLGCLLFQTGKKTQGIAALQAAVALPDASDDHWVNLAFCLKHTLRFEDALQVFRGAVQRFPDSARLHWQLSLLLLYLGHYREGFEEYEWRWKWSDFPSKPRNFGVPQWRPLEENNETVLIHAEQGFGDTIQFARWIPYLARHCRKLYVEVQSELLDLFSRQGWPCTVVPQRAMPADISRALPIMSIPHAFGFKLDGELASPPYLMLSDTQGRQTGSGGVRKVGLVWRGRPTHGNDARRSLALKRLIPLFDLREIEWVCLLPQDAEKEIVEAGLAGRMEMAVRPGDSFDHTARRIAELDLVITVDTSVAHLAAAGGVETWIMLPQIPDWRWGVAAEHTPWYRDARLFRCDEDLAWAPVIEKVRMSLLARLLQGAGSE